MYSQLTDAVIEILRAPYNCILLLQVGALYTDSMRNRFGVMQI